MLRLLHIQASPRLFASSSIRVGTALVDAFRAAHPEAGTETLNLFTAPPPEFNAPEAGAKYSVLSGAEPHDEEGRAWERIVHVIEHFLSFDYFVISSAMWNFSIPWRLKQYIDVLVQPELTFSYAPGGESRGLAAGRKAALVLARGGAYGPGSGGESLDFQKTYLEAILGFIGIRDIPSILIERTLMEDPEPAVGRAIQAAKELVARW
jgi:FMN-dependent NADH-azoreductase